MLWASGHVTASSPALLVPVQVSPFLPGVSGRLMKGCPGLQRGGSKGWGEYGRFLAESMSSPHSLPPVDPPDGKQWSGRGFCPPLPSQPLQAPCREVGEESFKSSLLSKEGVSTFPQFICVPALPGGQMGPLGR